jgi:hypothetical protein
VIAVFLAGLVVGLSLAMWIRWDQTQTLKEELFWARRRAASVEHVYERNRRWRGIYRGSDLNPERLP